MTAPILAAFSVEAHHPMEAMAGSLLPQDPSRHPRGLGLVGSRVQGSSHRLPKNIIKNLQQTGGVIISQQPPYDVLIYQITLRIYGCFYIRLFADVAMMKVLNGIPPKVLASAFAAFTLVILIFNISVRHTSTSQTSGSRASGWLHRSGPSDPYADIQNSTLGVSRIPQQACQLPLTSAA